jgi:crotonobetainyl-CoA:carnitine CoA-transferase CaiB-like acyl-CoA transferase
MPALESLRIIDLTQFMAGPLATQLLADMGAEVIKVERPGTGDASRHASASPFTVNGSRNAFAALNRNKRSITIDLTHPDAPEIFGRLIDSADVLIENFRPGVMERLGFGPDVLHKRAPRLIYCRITGYGQGEEHASWPGQDLLVQSLTGLTLLNGRESDPPTPVGPPVVDASAGQLAAVAILGALYERSLSGQGQVVGVSLVSAALWLQCQDVNLFLNNGVQPTRSSAGIASPNFGAPYGVYKAPDGYLSLAHTSLPRLAEVLEEPALAKYLTPLQGYEERDEIYRVVQAKLSTRSVDEWLTVLRSAGFWVAPVYDYEQCFKEFGDELVCAVPGSSNGQIRMLAPAITMDRTPPAVVSAPPRLGAETDAIAMELGFDVAEIAAFTESGGALNSPVDGSIVDLGPQRSSSKE